MTPWSRDGRARAGRYELPLPAQVKATGCLHAAQLPLGDATQSAATTERIQPPLTPCDAAAAAQALSR